MAHHIDPGRETADLVVAEAGARIEAEAMLVGVPARAQASSAPARPALAGRGRSSEP